MEILDDKKVLSSAILGVAGFELLVWLSALPVALSTSWNALPKEEALVLTVLPLPIIVATALSIKGRYLRIAAIAALIPPLFMVCAPLTTLLMTSRPLVFMSYIFTRIFHIVF